METTGDNLIQVKKERSYISCLVNGWSYGFKHLGLLLRYIWPGLILTSLLPFPFVFLYEGQVGAILRKLTELGYLPNVTINTLRDDVVRCSLRSMVTFLMVFLLLIVWGVPMFLPLFIGVSFWWGFLVSLVLFVAFLPPLFLISMHLLLSDYSIGKSISEGLRMGYKNFGKLFAFELLNILIIIPVYLIASIPFSIINGVCLQAYQGYEMGDVIDLPVLFPLVAYLSFVIFMIIMLTVDLISNFSYCLMWGSLVNEVPAETEADS